MAVVVVIGRLFLAAIFLIAGVAKSRDRQGFREALGDFGVHPSLVRPLAVLIPLFEIAVALALIFPALAWYGAVGALSLLMGFFGAVSVALLYERRPDCRCFGQLESRRAGVVTLVRIGLMAVVAASLALR